MLVWCGLVASTFAASSQGVGSEGAPLGHGECEGGMSSMLCLCC